MKPLALVLVLTACSAAPEPRTTPIRSGSQRVSSRVERTAEGDLITVQEVEIDAPRSAVWAAHTTAQGWMSWICPVAEVDLRINGLIRTHNDANAKIGDPGTNTLVIVNYVPEQLLTLRAEPADSWPNVMREDAGRITNTMLFISMGPNRTRLVSWGMGYKDRTEYGPLMEYLMRANESLYERLIDELEGE